MNQLVGLIDAVLILAVGGIGSVLFTRRLDRLEMRIDGRIDGLEGRVDFLFRDVVRRDEMDRRFDKVDERFDKVEERLFGVESEVRSLRSDITQVALALGVRQRPHTG